MSDEKTETKGVSYKISPYLKEVIEKMAKRYDGDTLYASERIGAMFVSRRKALDTYAKRKSEGKVHSKKTKPAKKVAKKVAKPAAPAAAAPAAA